MFISGIAFKGPELIAQAKYGILITSVFAGIIGTIVLKRIEKANNDNPAEQQ
jgi:NhaA family Na+:H+ antiporter